MPEITRDRLVHNTCSYISFSERKIVRDKTDGQTSRSNNKGKANGTGDKMDKQTSRSSDIGKANGKRDKTDEREIGKWRVRNAEGTIGEVLCKTPIVYYSSFKRDLTTKLN